MLDFILLKDTDDSGIRQMSEIASSIFVEYYIDYLNGVQVRYMADMFLSVKGIEKQLKQGHQFYFLNDNKGELIGFLSFYPRRNHLYLSKMYLSAPARGKGYFREILKFLISSAKELNLTAIELNVNKQNPSRFIYEHVGFYNLKSECNYIGNNFYMDDYVYRLEINDDIDC